MDPVIVNPETFIENPVNGLEGDARAMVDQCIECGSCYADCAFDNYGTDVERAKAWIRESNDFIRGRIKTLSPELVDANLKCAECNRCHESCPEKIYRRHGNMLMKHKMGNPLRHRLNIHPYSNWQVKQPVIERFMMNHWKQEEKDWYDNLNELVPADVLLYHGCYVYSQPSQCMKLEKMLESAGVEFTAVGKIEYCCGAFAFYRGHSDMDSIKPRLADMAERVNPKQIITNCGHCYNAMVNLANQIDNDIRPIVRHPVEALFELNVDRKIEFAYLGDTYAIHDSCNFRSLHDDHSPLRSFIRRIGTIHELASHGRKGQCCGDVSRYYAPKHIDQYNRMIKVREFVSSGADHLVTVCAGCDESFHNLGAFEHVDLIDIAYEAFSVARSEDMAAEASLKVQFENMAPVIDSE